MIQKKERQNYYFFIINKHGQTQLFVQFKELYKESQYGNGQDVVKIPIDQALAAVSTFFSVDLLNQTIIPQTVKNVEADKDPEFGKNICIDILVTDQFIASQFRSLTGLTFITISAIQTLKQQGSLNESQSKNAQLQYQAEITRKHEDNIQRMRQIYRIQTNYYSKDPFQSEDQPLGEKGKQAFDREIRELLDF